VIIAKLKNAEEKKEMINKKIGLRGNKYSKKMIWKKRKFRKG